MRDYNPLVSIVVNNYNYGRFLACAVNSALGQNYPRVQVIVVDDGSTDNSREVIASFGDRITPLFKENGGQASALNAGFAATRGEIVMFLDADDELLPRTVERVVEAFRAQPGAAKVMYRMEIVDAAGVPTGGFKPAPHLPPRAGDIRREVLTFPYDLTWMATSGNAFSAAVLRAILPMPEPEYRVLADYYLSLVSPLHGPVAFLPEVGARYRVHGGNNYETSSLDLYQVRATIRHMQATSEQICNTARRLGLRPLPTGPEDILSVSFVANRLVSLKLDPQRHAIGSDTSWRLLREGVRASARRYDAGLAMKAMYVAWFAATALSPRPLARRLAEAFFFPRKRPRINALLRRLHERDGRRLAGGGLATEATGRQREGAIRP